jgi:hypothetical protein
MSGNNYHSVQAVYQHHTDGAVLLKIDDDAYWFPLTTVRHSDPLIDYERGDPIDIEIQEWILVKNDLEWVIEE